MKKVVYFSVLGSLPSKSNSYLRGRRGLYLAPQAKRRVKALGEAMKAACEHLRCSLGLISGPVRVEVWWVVGDRRRRDLDNILKGILDAGNGVAYGDDDQVVEITVRKNYQKGVWGATIRIEEI